MFIYIPEWMDAFIIIQSSIRQKLCRCSNTSTAMVGKNITSSFGLKSLSSQQSVCRQQMHAELWLVYMQPLSKAPNPSQLRNTQTTCSPTHFPDISANQTKRSAQMYRVHLTDLGNDVFISTINGALKKILPEQFEKRTCLLMGCACHGYKYSCFFKS